MVARYAHDVEVGGPIPSPATKLYFSYGTTYNRADGRFCYSPKGD